MGSEKSPIEAVGHMYRTSHTTNTTILIEALMVIGVFQASSRRWVSCANGNPEQEGNQWSPTLRTLVSTQSLFGRCSDHFVVASYICPLVACIVRRLPLWSRNYSRALQRGAVLEERREMTVASWSRGKAFKLVDLKAVNIDKTFLNPFLTIFFDPHQSFLSLVHRIFGSSSRFTRASVGQPHRRE